MKKEKLDRICRKMTGCYRRIFGNKVREIYLYGSYARGDYDAIVDEDRLPMQQKLKQLWYEADDIDPDYEALISPTAIPSHEFEKYKHHMAYYKNILKEGRRIE